jgi:hypothetical protein
MLRRLVDSLPAWHRDSLCLDLELWYPGRGQPNQPALDICGRCPVRRESLAEAIEDTSLDHGIRGGMTANARVTARKARDARHMPHDGATGAPASDATP